MSINLLTCSFSSYNAFNSFTSERAWSIVICISLGINLAILSTSGSGIFNNRVEISKKTMGVDVISIGVPTVVDSKTIVSDVIEGLIDENKVPNEKKEEYYAFIQKTLPEIETNSIVTPTEIDEVIANISEVIANGINMTLN